MVNRTSVVGLLCHVLVAVACGGAANERFKPDMSQYRYEPPPKPRAAPRRSAAQPGTPGEKPAFDPEASATTPAEKSANSADPYADMPHPPDSNSGKHQLSAADVTALVETYRPHIRELCWIPRVNKTPNGKQEARVAIEIEVTKDGKVKSIRAVGGNEYDGLSDCVTEHVKRWHFPRAQQNSSLMFPIKFERGEAKLIRVK